MWVQGLIHDHFVAPFTITLSRFEPQSHDHFVALLLIEDL